MSDTAVKNPIKRRQIMASEKDEIEKLYSLLCTQDIKAFPQPYKSLDAPTEKGVYVIRKDDNVLHVGRTPSAANGIWQRLKNHLAGQSSFVDRFLDGQHALLRTTGYTYQTLVVIDARQRALLEAYATGMLCPKHIGLGE